MQADTVKRGNLFFASNIPIKQMIICDQKQEILEPVTREKERRIVKRKVQIESEKRKKKKQRRMRKEGARDGFCCLSSEVLSRQQLTV